MRFCYQDFLFPFLRLSTCTHNFSGQSVLVRGHSTQLDSILLLCLSAQVLFVAFNLQVEFSKLRCFDELTLLENRCSKSHLRMACLKAALQNVTNVFLTIVKAF